MLETNSQFTNLMTGEEIAKIQVGLVKLKEFF